MKITFSDNSVGNMEIRYKYEPLEQYIISDLIEVRNKYIDTLAALKTLGYLSEGAEQPKLIEWYKKELSSLKGDIKRYCKRPIKTEVEFTYLGQIVKVFAKISQADAERGLHSKKIGKEVAIRKLIRECQEQNILNKGLRRELVKKLLNK